MRWFESKVMAGALALAAVGFNPANLRAQPPSAVAEKAAVTMIVTVTDRRGAALAGATARDSTGKLLGRMDGGGNLTVACAAPCLVRVAAPGFEEKTVRLTSGMVIQLPPAPHAEQVSVTAYRTPMGQLESPVTTRLLSEDRLDTTAAITLDDELRQLPGVELFRRSSSLVANPSSQGMSLRGLGSTSASRTLITEDNVPLNDAFAGTIHWLEQPELAIESIELVRGGASDLYGSSAIGGVVSVVPARPVFDLAELRSSYGGESTYDDNLLLAAKRGAWGLLAAGGVVGTDGYIQEAPEQRGPVDINSNVHAQNGLLLVEHDRGPLRVFAHGSGFNEARNNGTTFQTNGTRLWRYATGGDWQGPRNGTLVTRLYGSTEHYRQTFSSISNLPDFGNAACSYRCGEIPTKFSLTPDNELGAAAHWSQPLGAGLLVVAGADTRDVRVWDREQTYGATAALTNLHDHQRDSGVYAEAMAVRKAWTLTASGRMDWFQNFDGQALLWNGTAWVPAAAQPARLGQRFFDPRVGISRKLGSHWAVSATGFRAFREPTPNELYRATQVGSQLTLPNGNLLSERATGWETGMATERRRGSIRASYFLTQVNRPITAVGSGATYKRENLGQIESKGVSLDYELAPLRWLAVDGGYQYAHATVTSGNLDMGNWIPEVARNLATINLRAFRPALGTLNLQGRLSGRQFDDAANSYLLHGYFRLDAYASHEFGKRLQLFAASENLLNRQIENSKTPTTTLGMPRVARIGFLVRLGGAGK
ncbi:MAG: TonB-dependent receptor [Terracidiphilus sp.]|nr:TonB-dependent receptor [Terracidiphilus sp.]